MNIIIRERLRALRKEKNETQAQAAAAIGIAEQQYQNYERATHPNVVSLWKLADHFGVSVDYLIGRTDIP